MTTNLRSNEPKEAGDEATIPYLFLKLKPQILFQLLASAIKIYSNSEELGLQGVAFLTRLPSSTVFYEEFVKELKRRIKATHCT